MYFVKQYEMPSYIQVDEFGSLTVDFCTNSIKTSLVIGTKGMHLLEWVTGGYDHCLEAQECLSADVQLHDDVALKLFNFTTGAQIAAMSDEEFAVFYGQYFDKQYRFTLKVTGANSRFPKITATSVVAC